MLRGVDKVLAIVSWVAAAALVLMLFAGPQVIAEDEKKPRSEAAGSSAYAGGGAGGADGEALFSDTCGSCHTLSAAGTSGAVGPNLDDSSLDAAEIEEVVRDGRGTMPSFAGDLSDAEIQAVAAFVEDSR
jgi:mono/diheme cytochrome c family protein